MMLRGIFKLPRKIVEKVMSFGEKPKGVNIIYDKNPKPFSDFTKIKHCENCGIKTLSDGICQVCEL